MSSTAELAEQLSQLGLRKGDSVLVRAAARAIRVAGGSPATVLRDALLNTVGPDGTIVGLSFTSDYYFWRRKQAVSRPFQFNMPAETGAFAQALLDHPRSVRSKHPTNSFVAVGANAVAILEGHDHTATSFFPIDRLMKLGGKLMLVGCVKASPGFSTVHRAQEVLNLAERTLLKGTRVAAYEIDGQLRYFRKKDISGCSLGFNKLYKHYVTEGILKAGVVGGAYSIMAPASEAFAIEKALLQQDPTAALCDDPYCTSCGLRTYAPGRMLGFAIRIPLKAIRAVRR